MKQKDIEKDIEHYYEQEMRYLREAGEEFAKAHEDEAGRLKIRELAPKDKDPYVERLFEGFAFLAARIHQRLDDELPEFTRSLMGLLWPHFLRPIPSLSILEFSPKQGAISGTLTIPRGTEVLSNPVKDVPTICKFRTCYDVLIQPITLVAAFVANARSVIHFRFRLWDGVQYDKLRLSPLRLFIHADDPTAFALHLALTRNVEKMVIVATDGDRDSSPVTFWGQEGIQAVGFERKESLFSYPDYPLGPSSGDYAPLAADYAFPGYRLLQEYFAYRRKFFFVDILGLDRLLGAISRSPATRGFEVQVYLKTPFLDAQKFGTENFHLFCTPIVNLFPSKAFPINVNRFQAEYQVVPPAHSEVYSVMEVEGIVGAGERRAYVPFYSFRPDRYAGRHRHYNITTRPGASGGLDSFIFLSGASVEDGDAKKEILSISVTCTNGTWPYKLKEGAISQPTGQMPRADDINFSNLTVPTLPLYPPLVGGYEWHLISHLALNYLSLTKPETLRSILELYEWNVEGSTKNANRNRITGIIGTHPKPINHIYRGSVIRGIEVKLEVDETHFEYGAGDLHLFGRVLREFFALYASINSFVALKLVKPKTDKSEEEVLFEWTPEEVVNDKNREEFLTARKPTL